MKWVVAVLGVACMVCSCREEPGPRPVPVPPMPKSHFGEPDESGYVLIDGSCAAGPPVEREEDYVHRYKARQNSLGYIRIRSSAEFPADDRSNVLGTVPCGTVLRGSGGLKNKSLGNALAYYVLIRDADGGRCRGYISHMVVDEVR